MGHLSSLIFVLAHLQRSPKKRREKTSQAKKKGTKTATMKVITSRKARRKRMKERMTRKGVRKRVMTRKRARMRSEGLRWTKMRTKTRRRYCLSRCREDEKKIRHKYIICFVLLLSTWYQSEN